MPSMVFFQSTFDGRLAAFGIRSSSGASSFRLPDDRRAPQVSCQGYISFVLLLVFLLSPGFCIVRAVDSMRRPGKGQSLFGIRIRRGELGLHGTLERLSAWALLAIPFWCALNFLLCPSFGFSTFCWIEGYTRLDSLLCVGLGAMRPRTYMTAPFLPSARLNERAGESLGKMARWTELDM